MKSADIEAAVITPPEQIWPHGETHPLDPQYVKFIYQQVFSELRLQCAETEAAVSGDGGGSKRRRRRW
jgi:hypothetical protein